MKEKKKRIYDKKRQFIVFFDESNEWVVGTFNSVKEICEYRNLPLTNTNINGIKTRLYQALKREDHTTKLLTGRSGKINHVYLFDKDENEE